MGRYYLNIGLLCMIFTTFVLICIISVYEQMYECFEVNLHPFNKKQIVFSGYSYAPLSGQTYINNVLDMSDLNSKIEKNEESSIDGIITIDDTGRYVFP